MDDLIAHLVARYKEDRAHDHKVIEAIDRGLRHYTHDGKSIGMIDVTNEIRAEHVAHIEMLDEAICLASRERTTVQA